ncbi:MAG: hypothetical protein P8Y00_00275 [Deltaproteobacteria bacterium]
MAITVGEIRGVLMHFLDEAKLRGTDMRKYDVDESIKNQKDYCESTGYPHMAPPDGICSNCRMQIYSAVHHEPTDFQRSFGMLKWTTGISTAESKMLVNSCPHCRHSFIQW